jgi:hypothetical protein
LCEPGQENRRRNTEEEVERKGDNGREGDVKNMQEKNKNGKRI